MRDHGRRAPLCNAIDTGWCVSSKKPGGGSPNSPCPALPHRTSRVGYPQWDQAIAKTGQEAIAKTGQEAMRPMVIALPLAMVMGAMVMGAALHWAMLGWREHRARGRKAQRTGSTRPAAEGLPRQCGRIRAIICAVGQRAVISVRACSKLAHARPRLEGSVDLALATRDELAEPRPTPEL